MEIISGAGVNGAIITCLETIQALLNRGHEITLVCRPGAWIGKQFERRKVDVIESDLHRWPIDELRRIARLARDTQVDLLHTHMSRANLFGVLLRRIFGIPCVATANNRYIQVHWPFNDRVIAVSEATKRFHHRFNFVPNRRMDVVHNFINCANYRTRHESCNLDVRRSFGFADSDVVVAQVGDVIPRKGLVHLVRALPEILQRCPAVKVLVVGRRDVDYARTVRTEIDRLGVGPAVVWAGYRADIGNILPSVDIFALATLEDSLPLAILEAMACGLPVVASRVGGIPECVVDGETGFLVRPKRPREFVTAVIRLAEDHSLRLRMGRAGRRRVETNFSHESQVERLERTFQRVLARSTTNTLQRGGSGVSMGLPNVRIVIPDRFAARQVADMDLPIIENR